MNPHTPDPDEGHDPAGRTPGRSADKPAELSAEQSPAQPANQAAAPPADHAADPAAEKPTDQPAKTAGSSAAAPADASATLPLNFPDTSATRPLDFPAGSGMTPPPDYSGAPPHTGPTPPTYSGAPHTGPTPPPYYGHMPPPAAAQPQNFFDWIRSQGIQRGRERWVGGVASGIAQRFGVDPLIVRGILVVLTIFAGIGVLLYGIAWALLPEPDGRIHVQEAAAGRWSSGMTGALITSIIGFPSLGSGVWGWDRYGVGPFIWTVLWVGGVVYLIYYLTQRNKSRIGATPMSSSPQSAGPAGSAYPPATSTASAPSHPSDPASPATPTAGFASTGYGTSDTAPRYGESAVPGPAWGTPPSAGPLPPAGGGYRPVPGGGPVPPGKARNFGPGAPAVAVTAGLALLVGGGLKALDVANVIDLGTASNAVVWASAAAVMGLGILIAGLKGRTSGILGFFAVAALITGGIYSVVPNSNFRPQNADWSPVSIEQARGGFDITAGSGIVDLTRFPLNPPLRTSLLVPIDATASNLTVVIPDTVPVEVRANMTMGNINEGSRNRGGVTNQQSNYNTDKPGEPLILEIHGTFSNVTIKEGN